MGANEFHPDRLTLLPFGLPGKIYRSPMPFRVTDEAGELFAQYRLARIDAVVVLAEQEEIYRKTGRDLLQFYADQSLEVIHSPIPDFFVPGSPETLIAALSSVQKLAEQGKNIAVHCYAGFGRTGLFMGCLATRVLGLPGDAAITWVRQFIPTALENEAQEAYVRQFENGGHHVD